ncbi:MAG: hypothetical protein U0360_02170 [Dehalococcoidia bacterium]
MNSLAATLRTLDFTVVVVVIRADAYLAEFKAEPMDTTLPEHPYHMALDFLAERLAMVLDGRFRGARGQLIVESRGPLEDAELQHEFARLQIDGTSYTAYQTHGSARSSIQASRSEPRMTILRG